MENRERTCLFHWTQSLEKHTKADIRDDLQEQHRVLCKQYKNASSMEDAEVWYFAIKAWWLSVRATTTEGLHRLELWLSFWHFRWRQWSGFMKSVRPCILNLRLLLALLCDLCCFVKVVSGLCAMFVLLLSRFVESLFQ